MDLNPAPAPRKRKRFKRRKPPPIFVRDVPSPEPSPYVPPPFPNDFQPSSSAMMDTKAFFDRFNQLLNWRLPDGTNLSEQGFNRNFDNFPSYSEGRFSGNNSNNAPPFRKRKISDPYDLRNRLQHQNKRWKESDDEFYYKKAVVRGEHSEHEAGPAELEPNDLRSPIVGGQLVSDYCPESYEHDGAPYRNDYSKELERDRNQRDRNFDGDQCDIFSRRNDTDDWRNSLPDRFNRGNETWDERAYSSRPSRWSENRPDDRQVKEYWPDKTSLDRQLDHTSDTFNRNHSTDMMHSSGVTPFDRPADHIPDNFNRSSSIERGPHRSTSFDRTTEYIGENYGRKYPLERGQVGSMIDEHELAREYRQNIPADHGDTHFQSRERGNRDRPENYPMRSEYNSYSGPYNDYFENIDSGMQASGSSQHLDNHLPPPNQSFEKKWYDRDSGSNQPSADKRYSVEELTVTIHKKDFARFTFLEGNALRTMLVDLVMKCDNKDYTPEFRNSGIVKGGLGFFVECLSKESLDWLMGQTLPPLNGVPLKMRRNIALETVKINAFAPKCNRSREEVFKLIKLQNAKKGFNFDRWTMRSHQSSPRGVYMAFDISLDEARKVEELGCQLSFELKSLTFKMSNSVEVHPDFV